MNIHESLFIEGRWEKGYGKNFISHNPATGEAIWEGPAASDSDVNRAVKAAQKASSTWALLPVEERKKFLHSFSRILEEDRETLIEAISQETGKPHWESITEVQSMQNKVSISIEAYTTRCQEVEKEQPNGRSVTRFKPHGVIAVLGPFNFPGHLPNGHIVPALLAGNTVVFKPSDYTPRVGEITMRCWEKAGIPPGVINLVNGGKEVGTALAKHPSLNGLFFTGSFPTGRSLAESFAPNPGKILALEMGGNNPLVVGTISDIKTAVYLTIQSAYLTAGQRCSCARRLIVCENEKSEEFIEMLVEMIHRIKVGPYTDRPEPYMGPVISEASVVRILTAQASRIARGAHPLVKLTQLKEGTGFVNPGLLDVTKGTNIPDEEIFGPLLSLIRVPNLEKAIEVANQTVYGLTAGILSDRREEYEQFYQKAKAGVINWNHPLTGASSSAPFGGIGCSGNHRPSAFFAADYSAYPVASLENSELHFPSSLPPGLE